MLRPMVVTMMKNETSNRTRRPEVSNRAGVSGKTCKKRTQKTTAVLYSLANQAKVVNESIANDSNEALGKSFTKEIIFSILFCWVVSTFMEEGKWHNSIDIENNSAKCRNPQQGNPCIYIYKQYIIYILCVCVCVRDTRKCYRYKERKDAPFFVTERSTLWRISLLTIMCRRQRA